MLFIDSFMILPKSPLPIFKPVFFKRCKLHVSILKSTLIRSSSRVCGSHYVLESFGEVVELNAEVCKSILLFFVEWIGKFFP